METSHTALCAALEREHVHEVYDKTAHYFEGVHFKAWPRVKQFLLDLEPGSLVGDIGCGSGRYLNINDKIVKIGSDRCEKLTQLARGHNHEVMVCDNLRLPYKDGCFDAVISIGVLHHLTTPIRRVRALQELARVLHPGGKILIYVWAMEQNHRKFQSQDILVPWKLKNKTRASRTEKTNARKATAFNTTGENVPCPRLPVEPSFHPVSDSSQHHQLLNQGADDDANKKHSSTTSLNFGSPLRLPTIIKSKLSKLFRSKSEDGSIIEQQQRMLEEKDRAYKKLITEIVTTGQTDFDVFDCTLAMPDSSLIPDDIEGFAVREFPQSSQPKMLPQPYQHVDCIDKIPYKSSKQGAGLSLNASLDDTGSLNNDFTSALSTAETNDPSGNTISNKKVHTDSPTPISLTSQMIEFVHLNGEKESSKMDKEAFNSAQTKKIIPSVSSKHEESLRRGRKMGISRGINPPLTPSKTTMQVEDDAAFEFDSSASDATQNSQSSSLDICDTANQQNNCGSQNNLVRESRMCTTTSHSYQSETNGVNSHLLDPSDGSHKDQSLISVKHVSDKSLNVSDKCCSVSDDESSSTSDDDWVETTTRAIENIQSQLQEQQNRNLDGTHTEQQQSWISNGTHNEQQQSRNLNGTHNEQVLRGCVKCQQKFNGSSIRTVNGSSRSRQPVRHGNKDLKGDVELDEDHGVLMPSNRSHSMVSLESTSSMASDLSDTVSNLSDVEDMADCCCCYTNPLTDKDYADERSNDHLGIHLDSGYADERSDDHLGFHLDSGYADERSDEHVGSHLDNGASRLTDCEQNKCSVSSVRESDMNAHPVDKVNKDSSLSEPISSNISASPSSESHASVTDPYQSPTWESPPLKDANISDKFKRYYHVFCAGELSELIETYVDSLHVLECFQDHANWCIVAEKVQVWTI